MANLRLGLDDIRRIESLLREIENAVERDTSSRQDMAVRMSAPDTTLPPAQQQLIGYYFQLCKQMVEISGPLRQTIMMAKQECGVALSPEHVKMAVQDLFADIKKSLDE